MSTVFVKYLSVSIQTLQSAVLWNCWEVSMFCAESGNEVSCRLLGCILHADDIPLLSATCKQMVNVCTLPCENRNTENVILQ